MSFTEYFVIFIMALILIMYIQNHYGEVEYIQSVVDKRHYLVRNLPDKQEAAEFLAYINKDLTRLVRHLYAKYPQNEDAKRLYSNFNPESVSEGSIESGYTSYSVNKGEKLILCIRQKDQSFVEKNVIMYVAVHELGHIMTKDVGHTQMFWDNFKFLLKEAMEIGLYKKVNYNQSPQDYCGIKITNSVV